MRYEKFNHKFPFVVVHYEGIGDQGSSYDRKEDVGGYNTIEEAKAIAKELYEARNDLTSSWRFHHYEVHVNTNAKEGKELAQKFNEEFDRMWKEAENSDDYYDVQGQDGFIWRLKKSERDDVIFPHRDVLESYSFRILDFGESPKNKEE